MAIIFLSNRRIFPCCAVQIDTVHRPCTAGKSPYTGAFPEPVNRKEYKGNMSDYIISCCSTADLSREHFEKRDLHFICFHFSLQLLVLCL